MAPGDYEAAVADAACGPIGVDAGRHGRDAVLICADHDPERVPPEFGGRGSAWGGSASDFGARRNAFRMAERPVRAGAIADVVDSGLFRVHGIYSDIGQRG